jgi:hypothetical protein
MTPENQKIVRCGDTPLDYFSEDTGGKGGNLLGLYIVAKELKTFNVPEFFIIPVEYKGGPVFSGGESYINFLEDDVEKAFNALRKPVAVRSSSPLEDGIRATFAGMFESFLGIETFEEFKRACYKIWDSASEDRVKKYAQRMGIEHTNAMGFVVQEQVVDPLLRGIIQLEEDRAVIESVTRGKEPQRTEIEYSYLKEHGPFLPQLDIDYLSEGDDFSMVEAAINAKQIMGFRDVVQVEFCFSPGKLPDFVQIRELPRYEKTRAVEIDMDIPEGVPYIESDICNGIAGELTLPAYVTVSHTGVYHILIPTGQGFFLSGQLPKEGDTRMDEFHKKSKLAHNPDFRTFREHVMSGRLTGKDAFYYQVWRTGNDLFPEYVLVCDKLDETVNMAAMTPNKKAIITCLEAKKTSHAMTIATDLGLMCMGLEGKVTDYDSFFHQVETGDMIHMKSNGKRAVAYVMKKRESDPYAKIRE